MVDLTQPLEPLTRRQRWIIVALALVSAASRFMAMARSLWDWDEALFCLAMRSYDVASHHPHPPGFPVYVGAARLLRVFIHDDFRSLQAVNLMAAVLVFPAMFLLARELRLRFETAAVAASLFAFFPNVWFFGGTAFSDVPSIVLVVLAVALYFRSCHDGSGTRTYLLATLMLALAIGIRPQNLLVGLFPGAVATWYRGRRVIRDASLALLIGVLVVGSAFGLAIRATGGWERYASTVKAHSDYISRIDSFRSPERPPLWRIADRFFLKQYQSPPLSAVTSVFVLISIVGATRRRDRRIGAIALTFVPFAIVAWLMLDRFSINRFSLGYAPLFAVLAADGIARATSRRPQLEAVVGGILIAMFAVWTVPALNVVRREVAPTVAVVQAAKSSIDPMRDDLFVGFAMRPFVEYVAPGLRFHQVLDERALPLTASSRRPYLLTEIDHTQARGQVFVRERARLWNIARRHYFVVALEPVIALPIFVSGWYGPERNGTDESRWMSGHSVTVLPPRSGKSYLRMMFDVPQELVSRNPTVTVTLNGTIVDRFPAASTVSRDLHVDPAPQQRPNELVLDIDQTLNPAREHIIDDPRDLGLRLRWLSWGPP